MKTILVFKITRHSGTTYFRCLKGNGSGGCKEKIEISKSTYDYLIKHENAKIMKR